ncbi:LapA family protein [Streptosporangium sp. CA-135522]|uniref:LapA family protein n=1 Tax=Streptosporangium sp. CA-135522 TaxID=3240072 RepID=UPI003D8AD089
MARSPENGSRSFGGRLAALPPQVWVALVLAALGAAFIAQNRDHVRIRWLTISATSPLWIALLAAMAVGVLIGLLLRRSSRRK